MCFGSFRKLFSCFRCLKRKKQRSPSEETQVKNADNIQKQTSEEVAGKTLATDTTETGNLHPERPDVMESRPQTSAEPPSIPKIPPPPDFVRRRKWPLPPKFEEEQEPDTSNGQTTEDVIEDGTGMGASEGGAQPDLDDLSHDLIPIIAFSWLDVEDIAIFVQEDPRTIVMELDEDDNTNPEDATALLDAIFRKTPNVDARSCIKTTWYRIEIPTVVWIHRSQWMSAIEPPVS